MGYLGCDHRRREAGGPGAAADVVGGDVVVVAEVADALDARDDVGAILGLEAGPQLIEAGVQWLCQELRGVQLLEAVR